MIRVVIDSGNAPPGTGIGIYSELLLRALQKYCGAEILASEAGISWTAYSLRPLKRLVYLARLSRLRRSGFSGAGVVHFTNHYTPRRVEKVRYILSIHDLDAIKLPEAHTRRYSWYCRFIIPRAIERAHMIITPSEAVREEVLQEYALPPDTVRVGGQGLSEEFMSRAGKETHDRPEISTVLYVGQISKKKNVAWLVRTFVKGVLRGALPRLRLVLAGGAGFGSREVFTQIPAARGIVSWYNRPSLSEIANLYSQSAFVVLPSLREGFGRPLLEALYCGKPAVASRIPSSLELLGEYGYYFTLNDEDEFYWAINNALEDPKGRERKSFAARQLEKYSWKNLARKYLDLYRGALKIP